MSKKKLNTSNNVKVESPGSHPRGNSKKDMEEKQQIKSNNLRMSR
jgi:hypothetical protein